MGSPGLDFASEGGSWDFQAEGLGWGRKGLDTTEPLSLSSLYRGRGHPECQELDTS